ncbi:hypothetical protein D0Z07_4404 [Hyphodiscus hymeniophilus]|uniref:Uncharacterized protein n=1 Tax=Hyphodiscus hymeniophilus TaxID=353542 RepID=A0A9P6VJP8_9HELO|nr:hypothetical protein D0Z07_4404 [Hyphodiscus hymeniophilus]
MSSDTPASAALILVPIAIVASAAVVALKTSHLYRRIRSSWVYFWRGSIATRSSSQRRKLRRSNLSSSQTYADSWLDLESNVGDPTETRLDSFINQTPDMAPKSKRTPCVELREPELPQPLRIIKQRGQTIAGCSAAREIEYRGRGISDGSDESRGSPPMNFNRPLTVRKRRGGGVSVLEGSFEEPDSSIADSGNAISELIKKSSVQTGFTIKDTDLTPKAVKQQVSRTMSAGAFLKTEFHSPRGKRTQNSSDNIHLSQLDGQGIRISPPKVPERRLSRSKTLFFKFAGRKEPKPVQSVESPIPKNTLIRRISRRTSQNSHSISNSSGSLPWVDSSTLLQHMSCSDNNSSDITDVNINSRVSSYGCNSIQSLEAGPVDNRSTFQTSSHDSTSLYSGSPGSIENCSTFTRDEVLLCPEIKITPEIWSLDAGSTNLWVAVEVTGVLRLANHPEQNPSKLHDGRRTISGYSAAHLRSLGHLHSMRIELITTRDASVLEVIGNLHESKVVCAGETHLILAKLRIAKATKGISHIRESSTSDEIMADLENDLGGAVTSYLTVRLAYKHSGFLDYKRATFDWEGGISSHTTKLLTESSAFIKRHNVESAWSPRASREMDGPLEVNPLIKLIEMHLPSDKARDAIRRLADDRVAIPKARRVQNGSDAVKGGEETVRKSLGSVAAHRNSFSSTIGLQCQSNISPSPGFETPYPPPPVRHSVDLVAEIDPARKIWTEMRNNSRGYRKHRTSLSDGHYYYDSDNCSPSRLSLADTVDEERMKIKDTALRNKRSVGADTLKSFAPSVGKGKNGTVGGVGLGLGRWWVNSNWW